DFDSLTRLVDFNIDNGTSFLVVLGTTAEAATLSVDEKQQVISHVVKTNRKRVPLVLGIGGNNTMEVKRQIEEADLTEFEAVLSIYPSSNWLSNEGLCQHFQVMAEIGKEIINYNVPSRTAQHSED